MSTTFNTIYSIVQSNNILLIIFGLGFDILGAFFLAKSFLTKSIKDITKESATCFASNPSLCDSLIKQKWDVVFGFGFIGLGFLFQLIYYLVEIPISKVALLVLLFVLVLIGITSSVIIKVITNKEIPMVGNAKLKVEVDRIKPSDKQSIEHYGKVAKLLRENNESDEKYLARLRSHVNNLPQFNRKQIFYLDE